MCKIRMLYSQSRIRKFIVIILRHRQRIGRPIFSRVATETVNENGCEQELCLLGHLDTTTS
jgi:hypothetical protein